MEVGFDADISGKTPFHFQGGSELFGSLVYLCRPCCLIPWTRDSKMAHSHILILPRGVHQHKEKNNGLSGRFSRYSLLTGRTGVDHALSLPILSGSG
jgi:hypothetical protein